MKKEQVVSIYENKFLKVYDLQYATGKHYFDASRRTADDLPAVKSTEEIKAMVPDAVSCVVVLNIGGEEKLLLSYEYRYPAGQYLLSVPAGLIDQEDKNTKEPLITTAIREIKEETGIDVKDGDVVKVINPCLFSSPGITDESNGIVYAYITLEDTSTLSQEGAVGSEMFNGFALLSKEEAKKVLMDGRDEHGIFYSVYTWIGLMTFVSGVF